MKKVLLTAGALVLSLVSVTTLDSCKKGENDPFLSLHSRKARMVGEWKLSAGETVTTSGGVTVTTVYTDAQKTVTMSGNSSSNAHTEALSIAKDGTFKYTVVDTQGSTTDTDTYEGTWNFSGRVGEDKNKEYVILTITKETNASGSTSSTDTYTGSDCPVIKWRLDQLKNKEIITKADGSSTSGSTTVTTTGTMTWVQ